MFPIPSPEVIFRFIVMYGLALFGGVLTVALICILAVVFIKEWFLSDWK